MAKKSGSKSKKSAKTKKIKRVKKATKATKGTKAKSSASAKKKASSKSGKLKAVSSRKQAAKERKATSQKEVLRTLFEVIEHSYDSGESSASYLRTAERKTAQLKASLEITTEGGDVTDTGKGMLASISPTGALLTDIVLKQNGFPTTPFLIIIRMNSRKGIEFVCRPDRFTRDPYGIGVKFEDVRITT